MDSSISSTDLSANKTSGLAANILSSFNSLFGSTTADANVFASFLAEEQASQPAAQPQSSVNQTSTSTQNTASQESDNTSSNESQNSSSPSAGTLNTLITGLHRIINKLKGNDTSTMNASNNKTNAANATANATNTAAKATTNSSNTSANATSQNQTAGTANNASSDASSADASGDGSDAIAQPETLNGILSELTALMKFMEKKLEAVQANGSSATTAQTDATDSKDTSAADPLTQLLSLVQLIQQQLTPAAGSTFSITATTSGATASEGASASPLSTALQDLVQIQKDLKGLMASLQDNMTGASGSSTDIVATASSGAASGTAADSLSKMMDQTASDKPSLASLDGFFDAFNSVFTTPFNGNFAPAAPATNANALIASVDSANGAFADTSTDMASQDNGTSSSDDGSANLGGLNATATNISSGQAEGAKSVDPYAFASQLSAARAANGGVTGLPPAVEQVLLQLNRGVKDGSDQMTIQLHPAELGKINVKLDISTNGQVSGTVVADNPSTLSMLHKDARSLERALQDAGLRADPGSLQFSLGGQGGNQSGQTANNFNSNTSSKGSSSSGTSGSSIDIPVASDEVYYLTPGRVNLKV